MGGAVVIQVMGRSALASRLPGRAAEFIREAGDIGKKVFTPVAVVILLLGVYLVLEGDWGFGSAWVSFGIVGIALSVMTGAGYYGPQGAKVARLIQAEGDDSPAVKGKVAAILKVARMEIGLLVFVVFPDGHQARAIAPRPAVAAVAQPWQSRGMARVRVSTMVDRELLAQARSLRTGATDAAVIDEALRALLSRHRAGEIDAAYQAYDEHPLDEPDEWGDLASFRQAAATS